MKKKAVQRILNVAPYQPGRPIDEVKRELGLKNVIKLASNENPFGPSEKVLKAIQCAAGDVNRYPDGGCYDLRQALSQTLAVAPEELIFGNGSDELIIMAIRAFVEPGDRVIISQPSFAVYTIGSRIAGADLAVVPMDDFCHDLDAMAAQIKEKTKLIFIDNPGNPSGRYVSSDDLLAFMRAVPRDVAVFLDEAYYEYVRDDDYPQTISWIEEFPNLIISRTFSKMYGLAGLRIGYAVACTEMIDILDRVREPFNINSLAQAAAIACLDDQDHYGRCARIFDQERVILTNGIKKIGLIPVPSVTNFVLVDLGRPAAPVVQALLERGVIVRDMTAWGLSTFLRVTIGTPAENCSFLSALEAVWNHKE
ncbi:MAG: histidinol-phosphate transaminase [Candidatus Omnitrophota bacterium]